MEKPLLKYVREILNNLYDPEFLRRSPLTGMLGLAERSDTPAAVQRCLENEIHALRPQPGSASYAQIRRSYDLLQFRYLEQFSQKEVAEHMGLSLRQYQREQQAALELLASVLEEKYQLTLTEKQIPIRAQKDQPETEDNFLDNDTSWLFIPSENKSCELLPILQDVIKLLQPLVTRHNVELNIEIPAGLPALSVHPVALRQILVNLLNAAIHDSSCGRIFIQAHQRKWEVAIELEGSNCHSTGQPHTGDDDGSLKIASQMAKLSGGVLSVSKEPLFFHTRLVLPGRELLPILIIDDSLDNIKLLQRYFTGTRYRMITITDPEMALENAEKLQPGLIVLDLMMPRVDGWELLGRLRNHLPTSHIPILIFSILPQEELALSLGADAFLRKPVTREKFLAVIDHHASG
jgi:CheY-like chemotaxis protein